jgi:hypothetical protein
MNAYTLIQTLTFTKATADKLETATNVLTELKRMKSIKGMPFLVIRRAIKMQEKVINDLK